MDLEKELGDEFKEYIRPAEGRKKIEALLAERGKTHGDYTDHATITQAIKNAMYVYYSPKHSATMRESMEMIAHKLGRILAGDPDFRDHWQDIAGYATLIVERCTK